MSNPSWGEERIANELLLKLGIRVSPRTVRKYIPKGPRGRARGDQRWSTFVQNHAAAILGIAFQATLRLWPTLFSVDRTMNVAWQRRLLDICGSQVY